MCRFWGDYFWLNVGQFQRSYLSSSSKDLMPQDPNWSYLITLQGHNKGQWPCCPQDTGIPIGEEHIDYAKNSFSDTYEEFYKFFNHENDQKAPSFTEAENWLLEKGKRSDTLWLWYWLEFAISSFLCPTSSTTLCVWAFHEIVDPAKMRKYNWRRLVVERLFKGITEFNQGERKSGCLLFLTVWCIIFFLLTQCKLFVFANYKIWPPPPTNTYATCRFCIWMPSTPVML